MWYEGKESDSMDDYIFTTDMQVFVYLQNSMALGGVGFHYSDITSVSWHPKALATWQFVQQLVQPIKK